MIEPDERLPLTPEGLEAWRKLTEYLERAGLWEEIYRTGVFVASSQSALYLQSCRFHGVDAAVTRECQSIARLWLCDLLWLDSAIPTRLDDQRRDADLVELCMSSEGMPS